MNKSHSLHKIIVIIVSCVIIVALYNKVDVSKLKEVFTKANFFYVYLILFSFVLIYILGAYRWKLIAALSYPLNFRQSLNMMLSAAPVNIVVPSKMGSFAKAYFMTRNGYADNKSALSMVIYEKLSDMAAMSVIFIFAAVINFRFNTLILWAILLTLLILLLYISMHVIEIHNISFIPRLRDNRIANKFFSLIEMTYGFSKRADITKKTLLQINGISLILWFVHTAQLVFFFKLLVLNIPIVKIVTYMLCAIVVGSLPVSFAGIGTRDISIVYLFKGLVSYSEALSIGVLSTLRYLLPSLFGLPFLIRMMFLNVRNKKDREETTN